MECAGWIVWVLEPALWLAGFAVRTFWGVN